MQKKFSGNSFAFPLRKRKQNDISICNRFGADGKCLAAKIDSPLSRGSCWLAILPSPKLSLKMLPKLPLPDKRGLFCLFRNFPLSEGTWAAVERQKAIRTSWITLHHFILRELIRVMITPPITPNNFWGFNKRKSQEKWHPLVLSLLRRNPPQITPKYSQRYNWRNKFHPENRRLSWRLSHDRRRDLCDRKW